MAGISSHNDMNYMLTSPVAVVKHPVEEHSSGGGLEYIFDSNVINFILVIVFLVWLVKKVDLNAILAKKQTEIADAINNAETEKKNKLTELSITMGKVSNLKQETQKIVDESQKVAESLKESIMEDAGKQAEDLHKKALVSVESQKQQASNDITSKITKAAFIIAEEHIKQAIDDRLHRKYIDEFIDNVETAHN